MKKKDYIPAPATSAIKPTSQFQAAKIANFNSNWQQRVNAFKQVKGVNLNAHVKPVWRDDMQRVKQGKQPYTNSEVVNFVYGLQHGKAPVSRTDTSHHGLFGIVGNAASDLGKITASLNPLTLGPALYKGALGLDAFTARAVGDILATHKYKGNAPITDLLNKAQSWIPGYSDVSKNVDLTVEQANKMGIKKGVPYGLRNIQGVNLVPGTYTTANLWEGKPGEIARHPLFTALDVLPIATQVGKATAAFKYPTPELIPAGSPWEALAEGKVAKAGTRGLGLTGEGSKATSLAQRFGVSSDIRDATGRWSQNLREGATSQKFLAYRDGYHRILTEAERSLLDIKSRIEYAKAHPETHAVTGIMRQELAKAEEGVKQAAKDVKRVGSADFIHYIWGHHSTTIGDLQAELRRQGMIPTEAEQFIKDNYTDLYDWSGRWSVNKEFKSVITDGNPDALRGQMVPKYLTDAMDSLNSKRASMSVGARGYRGATTVFKYAVLTGPRHLTHVLFSNAMFMGLDDMGAFKWGNVRKAWDMAHDPSLWPEGLQKGVGVFGRDVEKEFSKMSMKDLEDQGFTMEQIHMIRQGKTLARVLRESWATNKTPLAVLNPLKYRQWEESITNMSRAMEFMKGKEDYLKADSRVVLAKSDLAPGVKTSMNLARALKEAEPAANEAGLKQAIHVLMNIDSMTPFERTVLRQIFPFYPFTRQLIKYMMQFPADHPAKAAVLAAIGRIETEDAANGLPLKFMSLFPLTSTNSAGNALFIDTKNMNPFRSMNGMSPWTRAGFLSSLNPLITTPFEASGINILSASPELYPNLTVDPETGNLVFKPQENIAQMAAENIVPQFQSIDAALGWNKRLSDLRNSDYEAYKRMLFLNFNLPFTTGQRSITKEQIRYARNQWTVAQQDVRNAIKSNNISSLPYNYVPYAGKLLTPAQLQRALAG